MPNTAILLDGKATAKKIREKLANFVAKNSIIPCLAIVSVGDDPASQIYINNKKKAAEEIGISVRLCKMPLGTTVQEINAQIRALNFDPIINGIIVQLPLPGELHIHEEAICRRIWNSKDVDGFNYDSPFTACTPKGVIRLLDEYNIPISGKNVVICGRSRIVGKPLSELMLNRNATVTVCHSRTPMYNRIQHLRNADIIVSAVGIPNFIHHNDIIEISPYNDIYHKAPVLIDVGINRDEDGKLCGDISTSCYNYSRAYTPVPGGIGPMTVTMLMENTIQACSNQVLEGDFSF